jgi:hypothetical protein
MPLNLSTVNVGATPTLIYGGQGSQGTQIQLINLSTTVTIWVGYNQSIMPAVSNGAVPIGPGASITFDGTVSVYGITSGSQATFAVVPGGVAYSPGINISPLYIQPSSGTIAANSTETPVSALDVSSYASYDLAIAAVDTLQSTAGHAITFNIRIDWFDDLVSGIPIFSEVWNPWVMGQNPTHPNQGLVGSGPMHGQYMQVSISNPSGFAITIPYFNLFGSPRNQPLSDWRQSLGNHVTDHSFAKINSVNNIASNNVLVDTQGLQTVVSGDSYMIPLALYSGPVDCYFQASGGSVAVTLALCDVGNDSGNQVSGSISDSDGQMSNVSLSPSTAFATVQIFTPRNATALFIVCSGSGNASARITAQQGP